ncbi:MAG: hypothetical protein ACOX5J_11475 [Candidatus Hydrogenedentales bacterium]|jgi:hypothetical protein
MSSILGALALVIMCGSDLVQDVRVLPFDGMPMQYYSIDVYGQVLCVDYRKQTAQIVGILPEAVGETRESFFYDTKFNYIVRHLSISGTAGTQEKSDGSVVDQ